MRVLFVDNGINQLANISPMWDDLFEAAVDMDDIHVQHSLTPTLKYEHNIQRVLERDTCKDSYAIQTSIVNHLINMQAKARFPGRRKAQLEAFHVQVLNCTSADDVPGVIKDGKVNMGPMYLARY